MRPSKRLFAAARCKDSSWRLCAVAKPRRLRLEPLEDRRLLSLSVGHLVWNDLNHNGIQDPGEPGVAGAVVEVFQSTDSIVGNADDVSRGVTVTDASGHYSLAGLVDGVNYYLVFRTPVGYTFTTQAAGSDRTLDSDANSTGVTAMFTLSPGVSRTDLDAGLVGAAPSFGFALATGLSGSDYRRPIALDAAGNVYVSGDFQGTVDFDSGPGVYNLTSAGGTDAFVAKYSSNGALFWARQLGGGSDTGCGIAVGVDGSVYTTGYFGNTGDFDPGPGTFNLVGSGAFVSKLDSAGNFVWAQQLDSTAHGYGIAVAPDGSVYATGSFGGVTGFTLSPALAGLVSNGGQDIFVSKLDSLGNVVWTRTAGGTRDDISYGIAVGSDGSVYTTGLFYGPVDFDPGAGTHILDSGDGGSGYSDSFVWKLDSAGNFVWACDTGVSGTTSEYAYAITLAADGSVYTTGSGSANDVLVWKVNASGNLAWTRSMGGSGNDYGNGITAAPDGGIYVTGDFSGTADFDPGAGTFLLTSAGGLDAFVAKLDTAGNLAWACRTGGSSNDSGYGIAVAPDGSVYTTGYFQGTADFDPRAGTFNLTGQTSGYNEFVAKLSPNHAPTDISLSPASVPQHCRNGAVVGQFITSDADAGETFTYSLLDTAGGRFSLAGNLLRVVNGALLDQSQAPTENITVLAQDAFGATFQKTLTIAVTADPTCTVGDRVWNDTNGNGVQDAGEPGVAGAVVEIFQSSDSTVGNSDDVSLGQTATDANGNYAFNGLIAGNNYYLVFRTPVGYTFTTQGAGSDRTLDSDANSTGVTAMFTLAAGASRTDLDAGLRGASPGFGFGLADGESGRSVAVDAAGNVYVAGYFTSNYGLSTDFDPGPGVYNLMSAGNEDVFVAKYSSSGALYWAHSFGGTNVDYGYGVAVGADGSVYTTGLFYGLVDFDPGPAMFDLSSGSNNSSVFVSKLDAFGNFVWARAMGGTSSVTGNGTGYAIAVGSDGSIFTTGSFNGTVDFDPGPGTYNLVGGGEFVSKLDSAGNFVWARATSGGAATGYAIALGPDGSVCTTGGFTGTTDFNPGTGTFNLTSTGSSYSDAFVCKLDAAGNFVWACSTGNASSADTGYGIAVAADGSVYTTGNFQGPADFDPGPGTFNLGTAQSPGGGYVWKLSAAGSLVWAVSATVSNCGAIALNPAGGVSVTGSFRATTDFDPGPGTFYVTIVGNYDAFIWNLDAAGNFVSVSHVGGTSTQGGLSVDSFGIAVAPDGSTYTTGDSTSSGASLDVDPRSGTFNISQGMYLAKLLPNHAPTDVSLSSASVPGHVRRGTVVGQLSALDSDPGEAFTYTLLDSAGGRFAVVGSQVQVLDGTLLDYNQSATQTITVQVRDILGAVYNKTLTISVTAAATAALGDRVWLDSNGNGVQDAGEPGLAGAVVEVFQSADGTVGNADDQSLGSTITDANGAYTLTGLVQGVNYYLVFHVPAGYAFTTKNAGGDSTLDSDANASGVTAMFTLAAGAVRTDLDAGVTGAPPGFGFAFVPAGTYYSGQGQGTAIDAAGNVYVTGGLTGTADFDPGPGVVSLSSVGYQDVFVAKYTSAGALVWAEHFGGTPGTNYGNGGYGYGIAVAPDGSVYTTGQFAGLADFDPGLAVDILAGSGIFVSKLDSAGHLVWADDLGANSNNCGLALALGPDGSVCTTGRFYGTTDFDPGPGTFNLTSVGDADVFVSKLDSAGNFVWAKSFGGTVDDGGYGIAVAADGSVYTTGYFYSWNSVVDFDPGPGTYNLAGTNRDIFISKLDSAGNFVWARSMGGSSDDFGRGIAVATDGSVYTTGYFYGTVDFDPGPGTLNLTSNGGNDIFLSKLSSAGNLLWADSFGGTGDDYGYGIAATADGGVCFTGRINNTADFDPSSGVFGLSGTNFYVSKLDAAGNLAWAAAMPGYGTGYSIALAPDGSIYATGGFNNTVDFDPSPGTYNLTNSNVNYSMPFVWKWQSGDHAPTGIGLSPASVPQHSPHGAAVGLLSASDPDPNETLTYSLLDTAGGRFMLAGALLRVDNGTLLDYNQSASQNITVCVRDYYGASYQKTLTIAVTTVPLLSVGDRVWLDANGNGVQDAGEPGVAGAVVEVFQSTDATIGNADDVLLGQAVSDASGNYTLAGLAAGLNYYLVFHTPVGYTFTTQGAGSDRTLDSDAGAAGVTSMFTVAAGASRTDMDAGLVGTAPAFGFAFAASSGSSPANSYATATDAAGNVYVTGSLQGTGDLDPGPGVCNISGSSYVAKYSSTGALCWARASAGSTNAIAVAPDGSVYVTGPFNGAADFDPGPGVYNLSGANGVFVLKFDSAGNFAWARLAAGASYSTGSGIAVAPDGSVCTTGYFHGTEDFDPSPTTYNLSDVSSSAFVWKLDAAGNFVWARGLIAYGSSNGNAVAVDASGNVYTTGAFFGNADFDPGPGTYTLTANGSYNDIYVSKLDSAGNFVWARAMGGPSDDAGSGIALATDGSVYTTGSFQGTADFDPGTGTQNLVSAGGLDIFVSKLDSGGNFVWARDMGGSTDDAGRAIALAPDGSVYTTGSFSGTADFDPGPGTLNLNSNGGKDIFLSHLDSAGNLAGACSFGAASDDYGYGLAAAADGSVYLAGSFYFTVDFDPRLGVFNLVGGSATSGFVCKLLPNHNPTDISLSTTSIPAHSPQGTVVGLLSTADADANEACTYQLLDSAGGCFAITGPLLRVANGTLLDPNLAASRNITVQVRDSFGVSYTKTLTITVAQAGTRRSVGDRVWRDTNGNGVQDAGEPGVAGVVVEVFLSPDGIVGNADDLYCTQTVTDANGNYTLGSLVEGTNYYLVFRTPAGYTFTTQAAGSDRTLDSDANAAGITPMFTFAPGVDRTDLDAGLLGAAPGFGFAFRAGGTSTDNGQAIATDAAGNVYVTGQFYGTVDFDPGPGVYNLAASSGMFVAKYSSSGALCWAYCPGAGTITPSAIGNAVAVAPDGSVYATGYFSGTIDFDPGPGASNLTSAGSSDIFVVKLDYAGNFVWARAMGGTGSDEGLGIAVASDGSVYTTGYFQGTADFDPGSGTQNLPYAGGYDIFVSKLDSGGNYVWARGMGGASSDTGYAIAVAPDGSVYTTGNFSGTADFDPGSGTQNLTSAGGTDVFVAKLTSAGNYVWARGMGGTGNDTGYGIAVAPDGSVCTTGCFQATADFDPGAGTQNLTSAGGYDVFVSKLDSGGNFVWARRMGGTGNDTGYAVAVAPDGGVCTTGCFQATADFDPGAGTQNLTSAGGYDVFVSKLDSSGNYAWAVRWGGTSDDYGYAIAAAPDSSVYTTGYFQNTADFDPGPGTLSLSSAGGYDLFVSKLNAAPPVVSSIVINDGSAQRSMLTSMTVTFSTLVTLDAGALALVETDGSGAAVTVIATIGTVNGCTQATLHFSGSQTEYGSLKDGTYQLTVHGGNVHDATFGVALDGDGDGQPGGDRVFGNQASDGFFRFFGDSDGDRDVDNLDFARFRGSYNKPSTDPAYLGYFDSNADGVVNSLDLAAFRIRYLSRLDAGAAPAMMRAAAAMSESPAGTTAIRIALDPDDDTQADVFLDQAGGGPAYSTSLSNISQWYVSGGTDDQQVIIDSSNGNPLPPGGLICDGGADALGNQLVIIGAADGASLTLSAGQVVLPGPAAIDYANIETLCLDGTPACIDGADAVADNMALTLRNGATLDLGGLAETVASLTLDGGQVIDGTLTTGPCTLADGTISANLAGSGGLTKNTAGTLTLSGDNTYTGGTSVDDGLLVIDSSEAIPSGSTIAVGAGAAVVLGDPSLPSDGTAVGGLVPGSAPLVSSSALAPKTEGTLAASQVSTPAATVQISSPTAVNSATMGPESTRVTSTLDASGSAGVANAQVSAVVPASSSIVANGAALGTGITVTPPAVSQGGSAAVSTGSAMVIASPILVPTGTSKSITPSRVAPAVPESIAIATSLGPTVVNTVSDRPVSANPLTAFGDAGIAARRGQEAVPAVLQVSSIGDELLARAHGVNNNGQDAASARRTAALDAAVLSDTWTASSENAMWRDQLPSLQDRRHLAWKPDSIANAVDRVFASIGQ
jgi:autotransporter-associated beta strand protein